MIVGEASSGMLADSGALDLQLQFIVGTQWR